MLLEQYATSHQNEGVTFFTFKQPDRHCMPLSSAWLKWFLSAREEDLLAGRFDPYSQADRIAALQQNGQATHYDFKLFHIMQDLNLASHPTSSIRYGTIKAAVNLESNHLKKGALVLASDRFDGSTIGHAISFGFRRFRANKDEAIFGFFDSEEGMLLMRLNNFPPTQHEKRDEDDLINDTTHVVTTYSSYMAGIQRINHFFEMIQPNFPFYAFKCYEVKRTRPSPQQSPVMFLRKLGTSPRLQSKSSDMTDPQSPNAMSSTI